MADITQEVNIDMLEKLADGNYKIKYPKTKAEQVVYGDGSTAVYHSSYAVASGTNSYTVNIPGITSLIEGMSIKVKFTSANTGACTLNINGLGAKEIRKSNGNSLSAGNIKAGQICHLVYTGSVFQLLGEGGEYGTATADKVLTGYTIGTESGIVSGTMPNNGAKIITPSTTNQAIPVGYHNGSGYVKGDANLKPENIKKGVSIFGVTGTSSITNETGTTSITLSNVNSQTKTISCATSQEPKIIVCTISSDIISENDKNLRNPTGVFYKKDGTWESFNYSTRSFANSWFTEVSFKNCTSTSNGFTMDILVYCDTINSHKIDSGTKTIRWIAFY